MTAMLFNLRMDIYDIRRGNLLRLLNEYKRQGKKDKVLASDSGLDTSYISQLKGGHKNIGDQTARQIEEHLNLEHGWMDREHDEDYLNPVNDEVQRLAEAIAHQPTEKLETIKAALKLVGVDIPIPNQPIPRSTNELVITNPTERDLIMTYRNVSSSGRGMIDTIVQGAKTHLAKPDGKEANGKK